MSHRPHTAPPATSRRAFVRASLAAAAGLAAGAPALPALGGLLPPTADPTTFDLHLHPGQLFARGTARYPGDEAVLRTLREMRAGGVGAGFVSLVADAPLLTIGREGVTVSGAFAPGEADAEFRRQLAAAREVLPRGESRIVASMTEWRAAQREGLTAAWLACEGSEFLDGDAGRVDVLWEAGIRSIQLVHYAPNAAGDLQTHAPRHGGLSAFGAAVVRRMTARRMLVDVAHATFETVRDVARLDPGPLLLSHSLLRLDAARPLAARTISPEHARLVAATGGVVGAWPSATNASFAEFVENTKRLADVVGVAHVGLGTDMDANLRPVLSRYAQVRDWTAGLAESGFSAAEVAQMAGGNVARVLAQVVG